MDILDIPSPNFSAGRKGCRPEAIVIHIMEGTLSGTDSWFKNRQSRVSAHYGIGVHGEVHRYVQEADTAWHAGRVEAPTWTLIKPAEEGRYVNPNYYTIGIEHEGNGNSEWTDAMYKASAELVAAISRKWSVPIDRSHIIGHREIYALKTCPGSKADLGKIIEMAKQYAGTAIPLQFVTAQGSVVTTTDLNLRRGSPSTVLPPAGTAAKGTELKYAGYTDEGQKVAGVSRWYKTDEGLWFWGGGVKAGSPGTPVASAGGSADAGQEKTKKRKVTMDTTITVPYKLKKNGDHIKLSVNIGDAQKGVTTLTLGTDTLVSNREGDFTFDVGVDNDIAGMQLYCSTAVTAIRKETKKTSVTCKLEGGATNFEKTLSEEVKDQGDVVFYSATFLLM